MIDPTARISSSAEIEADVEIGPNVIIGDHTRIGSGTRILANSVVGHWTKLGNNNILHYGAIIGHDPQDFGYKGEETYLEIGNGNCFREYVTVHRGNREGTKTLIGNDNYFMVQCHVAHNCVIGNDAIIAGGSLLAGHVTIDDRAIISGNCVVHQFCHIGTLAMMRGLSRTSRDVPPFCIMDETHTVRTINLVGLRRNGYDSKRVRAIKNAFKLLFRSGPNMKENVERAESELEMTEDVRYMLDFIKNSKRGVCFGRNRGSAEFD
ncbi:MAG: acyl-ACP--UDP-N-acetylglucosamine O-acyltransferase [Deltaproteobacteria bacterium]|nr:acyl-ACP--UDP-N-acetylglucosamine O-acyltransferase [Deltaproteobacteria bacterium]TLN05073.1 MAG: acyl-ACP--UDP-N-acetylglucosamine O-acyltransferase [bacterium]